MQKAVGGEVGFDDDDCIVEIGLIEIAERRISQNRRSFDDIDVRMGIEEAQQFHEPGRGVTDIASDSEDCGMAFG